jgi:glutaredoxin
LGCNLHEKRRQRWKGAADNPAGNNTQPASNDGRHYRHVGLNYSGSHSGPHPSRTKGQNFSMESITMYTTAWCADCTRAKSFLKDRGVEYREVNIEEDPAGLQIVIDANHGKRKVPTLKVGDRYFACSPFNPVLLASELKIPLNS